MATTSEQCPNYAINIQMCPCGAESCTRRGICCECIAAHRSGGSATACMRGKERPEETLSLRGLVIRCDNAARNAEACPCPSGEGCVKNGVCCECVRNHWTVDGAGRTSCMK
jgi:hypothetical protein